MRFLIFALTLLFSPCAFAQDGARVGALAIGMTIEEARAVAPGIVIPANRQSFQAIYGTHQLDGVSMPLQLVFVDGVLDYIGSEQSYVFESNAACFERFRSIVAALETTLGALDDAPDNSAAEGALAPIQTPGGSIIRASDRGDTSSASAIGYAPIYVEAFANAGRALPNADTPRRGAVQCWISLSVNSFPPPADLPVPSLIGVTYVERPASRDFARYYPSRAMDIGRSGMAILFCTVRDDYGLDCAPSYEGPHGWGFGEAALRLSRHFRVAAQGPDGASTVGQTVRLNIRFRTAF